jgi:glucosamine-6-phosphate deaminase
VEVVILPDAEAVGALAADAVCALLDSSPEAVLGLATGSSPLATYRELIRRHRDGEVTFARARAFLLDEYVGLAAGHPQRYRNVLRDELEAHVDFADGAVAGPDGLADDLPAACAAYEAAIAAAGGVDLQLLGIGSDGHIAFNEPGSSLSSRTRVKTLTAQTRADNARFFASEGEVPRHVLTQGLGTIRDARHCLLVAAGESKAAAVAGMVEGPVSAMCPGSVLQLHPHATVLLDEAAAGRLRLADYFRETWAGKPGWQGL